MQNTFQNRLLVVASEWPEPTSSAAGSRMMQILDVFLELSFEITYAATAHYSEFMFDLEAIGIKTKSIALNSDSFDIFIKMINPTVVLFDRFISEEQFGWRVINHCPAAMRILDTEDLHFLRKSRQESIKKHNNLDHVELQSNTAKREIASILRCDISLIISQYEMNLLKGTFNISQDLLFYLPFMFDNIDDHVTSKWLNFEQRKNFVFIGNFFHEPNIDAVVQLKTEIWPRICRLQKGLVLDIYGAYPNQQITQMHQPSNGFLVHGRAENALKVIGSAKCILAPIRFGAGLKGKLAEAQLCGTPSVTTPIGAEAMSDNELWGGFITDDLNDFAQSAVTLYNQRAVWTEAQMLGQSIFNERYNKTYFTSKFIDVFLDVQKNLAHYRKQNFVGAMLLHHSMQSTKYMSMWIVEKNKNKYDM